MHEWAPEIRVDEPLARRLIGEQFPEVEVTPPAPRRGLGHHRLPRGRTVEFPVPAQRDGHSRIPERDRSPPHAGAAPPLPIPLPTLVGEPSAEFQWPFYGAPSSGWGAASADLDDEARAALALPLAEFLRTLHGLELDADLPLDPVRRADMPFRVEKTRERMDRLASEGLWHAPPLVEEVLVEAERIPAAGARFVSATATCTYGISWSEATGGRPRA